MNRESFSTSIRNNYLSTQNSRSSTKQPLLNKGATALLNENSTSVEVNRLLIDNMTSQLFYGSDQFLENSQSAKSSQFLDQITYKVDLSKLYKIKDTCYINQSMPYCPILVENTQPDNIMNRRYLLQVWDDNSQMVYMKALNSPPTTWFITFNTLVFLPDITDQEPDEECYYIVFLHKNNCMVKLDVAGQEFGQIINPLIGFCNMCLYISSGSTIYIINVIQSKKLGPEEVEYINDFNNVLRRPYVIDLGLVKNHGFLVNQKQHADDFLIICCETSDNQIDFSILSYKIKEQSYIIKQIQEVVQRNLKDLDPIIQFKSIHTKEWPYSIVLRQSGNVDFYWNYLRIGHSKASNDQSFKKRFLAIEINFEGFYLIELISSRIIQIGLQWKGRIGLDVADPICIKNLHSFDTLFQQKISNKVNFYHTSCLINTSFVIAHHKQIFIYDIIKKEWILNFECNQKIVKVFRNEKSPGIYNIGIMLDDGSFDSIENVDTESFRPETWTHVTTGNNTIQGVAKFIARDLEHYRMLYILSQKDQEYILQAYTRDRIHQFQTLTDLSEKSIILPLFSPNKDSMFIVYNQKDTEGVGKVQIMQAIFKLNQDKTERMLTKQVRQFSFQDEEMYSNIGDHPYVAISRDIDQIIFFISKKNIYKIDLNLQTVETIYNTNISGIQVIDDNHCYAIVNNPDQMNGGTSGLKYFTIDMLINSFSANLLEIDVTVAGPHSFVDFSEENQRLTYLKTYETAHIIPVLHRSTINYMGMLPRKNYLAVKKLKNQFMALDKYNRITVWNVLTGKLVAEHQLQNCDYHDYNIFGVDKQDLTYQREWYQPRTLIVSTIDDYDEFQYSNFQNQNLSNEIKKGIAYVYNESIKYHSFKLIEIQDSTTVKEHLMFVHQHYQDKFQRIYISDDNQIMIERLVNLRVLVYKNETDETGISKWILIKRFEDFPHDLSELSQSLFMFSPSLTRYINFDKVKGRFFIKMTLGKDSIEIPQSLMNPIKEEPLNVIKRFKWVDNDRILLCNGWGFEKLILIQDSSLIEISSSQIPAFNSLLDQKHVYVEPESLELGSIIQRLLRKYRDVKRQRYIFEKDYQIQIYDELYQVDYNVQNGKYKFVSDLSFSHISWKLIEDIFDEVVDIKIIDQKTLMILSLNILPGCQTILHKLSNKSSQIQWVLQNIPIYQDKDVDQDEFEMPFIQDLKNKTALHICYESQDYKTADSLIRYLSNAPIDHHGKAIKNLIPELIKKELPSLLTYFDQRLKTTPQLKKINRGQLKKYQENLDLAFTTQSLWADNKQLREELFLNENNENKKIIQSDVELQYLDLPDYHYLNLKYTRDFFKSLKETEELQLFELKSIRFLIDFLWPMIKQQTKKRLFIPFVFYLLTYWVYTNFVYDYYKTNDGNGLVLMILNLLALVGFSIYFLFYEMKQAYYSNGYEYFGSPWNYIDLTPPVIMISQAILAMIPLGEQGENLVQSIQAIGSLLMWLKLLYFFRINKDTAYLIRMIAKVIHGMRTFLGVLLITIVAFGDAFVSLQNEKNPINYTNNDSVFSFTQKVLNRFINSCFFVYKMILGDVSLEDFDSTHQIIAGLLVVFCTLFVMIIMLNLLVSIIGQVYSSVQENQINEFYQEKATIIAENSYLIPKEILHNLYEKGQYLLVAKKVGEDINSMDEVEEVDKEQKQMNNFLQDVRLLIDEKFSELESKIDLKKKEN